MRCPKNKAAREQNLYESQHPKYHYSRKLLTGNDIFQSIEYIQFLDPQGINFIEDVEHCVMGTEGEGMFRFVHACSLQHVVPGM
jgi:hypothetical protein